jgi:hypothetical protein
MSNHGIASTSAAPAQSAVITPMKSLGMLDVTRPSSGVEKFTAGNFWAETSEVDMFEADTSCAAAFCSMDAVSPLTLRSRSETAPDGGPPVES